MTTKIKPQIGLSNLKPYSPGTPIEEVKRKYGIEYVIKLASNENALGTSPLALEAVKSSINRLNFYPDYQSYDLRQALAKHYGINADQIIAGNGSDGLITQLCLAYLDDSCSVIVSESSFPVYDTFTHIMRAKLVKTPLVNYTIDLDAMAEAVTSSTKLIFVSNPNNPTGTIVSKEKVKTFVEKIPDDVLIIFDEAYHELVTSDEYPDSMEYIREGRENILVMRTFSKVHGLAGVRLGYAIAMPSVIAPLYQTKEAFGVNLLAQAAGIAALQDIEFINKTVEANRASLLWLYSEFKRLELEYVESHANFVLVKIGPDACKVQQKLLQNGVIVRPCNGYNLPDFLRISIGTPEQNATFINALEAVLNGRPVN